MRRRPAAATLLTAFASIALLIFPHLLAADTIEDRLKVQYKGETLILLDFPEGGHLTYDSKGVLITATKTGDWTVGGVVKIKEVKVSQGQLTINASRTTYEPSDHGFLAESNGGVRIDVDLGPEVPDFEKAKALLSTIFLNTHDDFAAMVQDLWRACVSAGLMAKPPRKYAGCSFPVTLSKFLE